MRSRLHSNRYFDPSMYYKGERRNSNRNPFRTTKCKGCRRVRPFSCTKPVWRYRNMRDRRYGHTNPGNFDRSSYATNSKPPSKRKTFMIGKHLYIYNISRSVNVKTLKNMFRSVGPLKYFAVHYDKRGRITGTGEVRYEDLQSVYQALARFHGVDINGRNLDIRTLSV